MKHASRSRSVRAQRGRRAASSSEICHAWDEPLTPEVIKDVERQFGPLANTLADLVKLLRRIGEWYVKPYSDNPPSETCKTGTVRMLRSAPDMKSKLCQFLVVPSPVNGLVVQALVSTRRLRPVIEMVIGKDAAAQFYDRLCRNTTLGWGFEKPLPNENTDYDMHPISGRMDGIVEATQQLNQRVILLSGTVQRGGSGKKRLKAKPLSPRAALIYERLCALKPHEAMTRPRIQSWYEEEHSKNADRDPWNALCGNLDDGTWNDIRKELLPWGLKNEPRVGYYIQREPE